MKTQNVQILIVDDDVPLVYVCQIILEKAGHEVSVAYNGRHALRLVAEEMPDIILLDVMMPDMNGIEVCRHIRDAYPLAHPHILMYTADNREEIKVNSFAAGANAFITKRNPFQDLPDKINLYLTGNKHLTG